MEMNNTSLGHFTNKIMLSSRKLCHSLGPLDLSFNHGGWKEMVEHPEKKMVWCGGKERRKFPKYEGLLVGKSCYANK